MAKWHFVRLGVGDGMIAHQPYRVHIPELSVFFLGFGVVSFFSGNLR